MQRYEIIIEDTTCTEFPGFVFFKKLCNFAPMQEERLILERIGKGDRAAFAELYHQYAGKIFRFALSLTKEDEVSKDIVHDIFVKIWESRTLVSKVDSINAYLYRMTRNKVLQHFQKNAIEKRYCRRMQIHKEEFRDCVSESVTERELEVILMNALSTMPEKRHDVFILRKLRGMTTADVAALLGISTRTVEAHMSKALSDVRLAFSENFT